MNNNTSFFDTVISIALLSFYRTCAQDFNLIIKDGIFSLGIIWSCLKQLIIIAGISFVFSVGLKGSGLEIEYLFFNLLIWFMFSEIVNSTINQPFNGAIFSQNHINAFNYFFGHILRITVQYFILLFLSFIIFSIFGLEIFFIRIVNCFILMMIVSLIYAIILCSVLHKKTFLIELHGFFMQALFFASATVIPISIIPNPIRDILLYIPIVHIQEWLKSAITGVELAYVDINYVYSFIFIGIFMVLPSLHYKNNQFIKDLDLV